MKILILALAAAISAPAACSSGDTASTAHIHAVSVTARNTAKAALQTRNYDIAFSALDRLSQDPDYRLLPDATRLEVDRQLAFIGIRTKDWAAAHRAAVRATESRSALQDDWLMRLETARGLQNFTDAYLAFQKVAGTSDFADVLTEDEVSTLDEGFGLLPNGPEARFQFESYLLKHQWRSDNPFFSPDVLAYHYAIGLDERDQRGEAIAVAKALTDPDVIAAVEADRRFDAAFSETPKGGATLAALEARLKSKREMAAAEPDWTYAQMLLATALYDLGRYGEALDVVDRATAKAVLLTPAQRREYAGFQSGMEIARMVRAQALFRVGRQQEALGYAAAIGQISASAEPNPESLLLQGRLMIAAGRGHEALSALEAVDEALELRPNKEADLQGLIACAAVLAGKPERSAVAIAALNQHPLAAPDAMLRGLLCAGRQEQAATYLKSVLADPNRRHLALQAIQVYAPPGARGAFEARMERNLEVLRNRDDIQIALAPVGRINTYPLPRPGILY